MAVMTPLGESPREFELKQKLALAQALQQQGADDSPIKSPWQGLARMGQAALGGYQQYQAQKKYEDQQAGSQQALAQALSMMQGTPAWQNPDAAPGSGPAIPARPGNKVQAYQMLLNSNDPQLANLAFNMQANDAQLAQEGEQWKQHFDLTNKAENDLLARKQAFDAQQNAEQRAAAMQAAQVSAGNRNPVAIMTPDGPRYVSASQAVGQEPYNQRVGAGNLPVSMQKAEDADLEAVDLARNISSDLAAQREALKNGAFKVDPISKGLYAAGSAVGMGGPETASYNSFRATLEKMRNDSLRLNKGVQTEGDAVRAWNELFTAMGSNDAGTVQNRLSEIEQINQRAAAEAQRRVDIRRQRNGTDAFDWKSYGPMGSPLAKQGQPPSADDLVNKYLGGQ